VGEIGAVNGLQILGAAGTAVGQKISGPILPNGLVPLEHRGQRLGHIGRRSQLTFQKKWSHSELLPGQSQITVVVDLGPFKAGAVEVY
jgi:hypothetical protein